MAGGSEAAKRALRQRLLAQRRALVDEDRLARSLQLQEHLLAEPLWARARGIAAFVGVGGEPDTRLLLERTLAACKRLWLPRVLGRGQMRFWTCDAIEQLERSSWGLLEPPAIGAGLAAPGPEHGVDLVLVPGLGFGTDGARLGFGAGHYDRAFGQRRSAGLPMPILVGVCLAEFLLPSPHEIPMLSHDLPMDFVVSELGIERCHVVRPNDGARAK